MEKNKMETFVFIFTPTTFNLRVLQTIEKKMKSPTKMRRQLKPQNPESIFFLYEKHVLLLTTYKLNIGVFTFCTTLSYQMQVCSSQIHINNKKKSHSRNMNLSP